MEKTNPAAQNSFFKDVVHLFACLSKRRKIQLSLLFILQTTSAVSEMAGLGAIVPFLAALTNINGLMANDYVRMIMNITGITEPSGLIMLFAGLFAGTIVIANILRFTTLWVQVHLAAAIGTDLGMQLFKKTLFKPYGFFVRNNSSNLISNLTNDLNGTLGVLQEVLTLFTQGLITAAIVIGLLIFNPQVALILAGIITCAFTIIMLFVKKRLYANSLRMSDSHRVMIKALQEGFGGIRYIVLGRSQNTFVKTYEKGSRPFRDGAADNSVIRQSPRFLIEAIGVVLISTLTVFLSRQTDDLTQIIPLLGFLGLAAHRLLPAMQQVYGSLSMLYSMRVSLRRSLEMLTAPVDPALLAAPPAPLYLKDNLKFENVSFSYNDGDWTIKNLDLEIKARTTVALVGHTGSGKSTLSDLMLGLIQPQKGNISVDGQKIENENILAWQSGIAHVPQHIFLTDSSIAENIAFGLPKDQIDQARVIKAAKLAMIDEFINTLPNQYNELVGERGVRLSGGQLQRIGIARALYQQPSLIIFDEATSALDNTTEKDVMTAIDGLSKDLTIILIAHRLSTVKNADNILVFEKGSLVAQGTYAELSNASPHFKELVKSAELD